MKNALIITGLIFVCSSTSFCQNYHFRTDGYYFFDNGSDTIRVCYMFPDVVNKIEKEQGFTSCVPKGAIPLEGGTYLHYIAFFNDSSGTSFGQNCRDIETFRDAISHIRKRRSGEEKTQTAKDQQIYNVVIKKDGTFSLSVYKNEYFLVKYKGRFKKDYLEIYAKKPIAPSKQFEEKRIYRFYKLDQIPPAVRKQFTLSVKKEDAYYKSAISK